MNHDSPLILLAEDQEDLRQTLVEFLTLENYRVLDAENGQKAYALAAAHQPDLIISDVAMPVWDGLRLLAELKTNPATSDIPLLFLSAWANRGHVRNGMQLGAVDYITKPFALTEISSAITAQLEKRRAMSARMSLACDQARARLMSILPHEMLTPLNAILGPSELLFTADDAMPMDEVREWAGLIMKNAAHLARMIEKMLIYAELQGGNISVCERGPGSKSQHATLIEALEDFTRDQLGMIHPAQITGTLGATCLPDHAIKRIGVELLDNAYKFSPADGSIKISIQQTVADEILRISNTCEEKAEDLTRRLDGLLANSASPDAATTGIGLGLAIVAGLLKHYRGKLSFEASEDHTITAVAVFPRA